MHYFLWLLSLGALKTIIEISFVVLGLRIKKLPSQGQKGTVWWCAFLSGVSGAPGRIRASSLFQYLELYSLYAWVSGPFLSLLLLSKMIVC